MCSGLQVGSGTLTEMRVDEEITIVIPTHNEIDYLPHLIYCLEKQTFTNFTIIVVDNHSTDGTRQFCETEGFRVVNGGHPGKSRNIGAELSSTECILFLDADKQGYIDYLNKLLPKVRPGGLIIAHNMTPYQADPAFVEAITSNKDLETLFLHMDGAGVSVTLKKH